VTFRHLRNSRGFFSDYYLGSVFGRGSGRGRRRKLSDRESDTAYARFLRIRERAEGRAAEPAECRERFVRPLLRDVLGFHLGAGEERIHGLFASADTEASGQPPILACYCGAWDEDLDAGRGASQPARRAEAALARLGLRHAVLVTGERLRLVRAAGEGPPGAHLEVDLAGLAEEDDPESFAAFHRLFSASSFLQDAQGNVPIDEVERESRRHAEKVSDDLKQAVFTAAESLVSGLIADATARGTIAAAAGLDEGDLRIYRDAALLALYRILFILYAEARDPRLDEHRLYRDSYSAQGLLDEVLREPCRAWPENRCSLWLRLRALFRIYDEGLPPITPWQNIPPRGGDFFSAETPEGALLDAARLPDRTVAALMLYLATTAPRRGVGRERVSFRELDIENLGAVYEGLLEFEPRVSRDTMLEVRVQGRTFVLGPADVVRLCEQKSLTLRGEFGIVEGTEAASLHPDAPADDDDDPEEDEPQDEEAAEAAGENEDDGDDDKGVRKGATARLVRRLEPGAFHFVPGPGRKGSGSFYTPRPLVQDLVRHAVGPLVVGKTAAEVERLRVLDPACGSAHFLVEAMRFLGQALHRAYVQEHDGSPPPAFRSTTGQPWDDHWRATDEEARAANSEARAWCKRRIAERCLFGVDLNPTAVQLARVALWIESVAGDRPLTYFEHHVRAGNSLLGTWLGRLRVAPLPALSRQASAAQPGLYERLVRAAVAEAARIRRLIDEAAPDDLLREGIEPDTVEEQDFKERQRRRAEETLAAAQLLFDLRSSAAFLPEIWREWNTLCGLVHSPEHLRRLVADQPWSNAFERLRERERFFHWELEFPEVFLETEKPGFDAVLGNPPWGSLPVKRILEPLRSDFCHVSGPVDSYQFFLERAVSLLPEHGRVGLVLPDIFLLKNYVKARHHLLTSTTVERVCHWGAVFDDALVDVCTVLASRAEPSPDHLVTCRVADPKTRRIVAHRLPQARFLAQPNHKINLFLDDQLTADLGLIASLSRPLGAFANTHEGIHSGNVRDKLFVPSKAGPDCKPLLLAGREVRPFRIDWHGGHVRYDPAMVEASLGQYANLGRPEFFERPKIVVRRTGDRVIACRDDAGFYVSNNFFVVLLPIGLCPEAHTVVEAVLNSSLATWYFRSIQPRAGRLFAELKLEHLRLLPLPRVLPGRNIETFLSLGRAAADFWRGNPEAQDVPVEHRRLLDEAVFEEFGIGPELRSTVVQSVARYEQLPSAAEHADDEEERNEENPVSYR